MRTGISSHGCIARWFFCLAATAGMFGTAQLATSLAWAQTLSADAGAQQQIRLGVGDSVTVQVYGQPEMGVTAYVAESGSISVPLVGAVPVAGTSPAEAARRIETALRDGKFLVQPQVTVTVTQSRSQRVSVLGEVHTPGRYAIDYNTPIYDVLAEAGGTTPDSDDTIFIMRRGANGEIERFVISLAGLSTGNNALSTQTLQGGDTIMVPRAKQFYIRGEVQNPNMYRIESGMTVEQALARAGGITPRGSSRNIEIQRRAADGSFKAIHASMSDTVMADDVIRVKERLF